jgi:peptidoglycan-associated lipoprotein
MRSIISEGAFRFGATSFTGLLLFGSVFLLLAGCAKKVETTQETTTAPGEERAAPPSPQQRPLQEEVLPSPPPTAEREAPRARAEQPSGLEDVFFDFDKWTLRSEATSALERDARWLAEHRDASIQIEGHCDERGTNEYNLALGERRAKAVKNYLVNLGVEPGRLSVISFGEERPFCTEHSESCYQKNRRGHFVLRR